MVEIKDEDYETLINKQILTCFNKYINLNSIQKLNKIIETIDE